MTEEQVFFTERLNSGTSKTNNEQFEKDGYLVIKNLWDPKELYHPLPSELGQINYWGTKLDQFTHQDVEMQVEGSLARYWHPQYRQIHSQIRIILEKIIGKKLYNTYYYDRFYFPGQELIKHTDRDACEISVSVHIGTNLVGKDADWPICIKTPDTYADDKKTQILISGENRSVVLKPGDGMLYKGCERPHWRNPMPKSKTNWFTKKQFYYHQIFFHYVLSDGMRCHCYMDKSM